MKNVIITGGPTNEFIDEVMKITNMSTGSLGLALTKSFLEGGYHVDFVVNKGVDTSSIKEYETGLLFIHEVETTEEMMKALEDLSKSNMKIACLIHVAAVGDYKADFTFLMEDLAEILYQENKNKPFSTKEEILTILKKGDYRIDNSSKISSYQESLSVKLALTPKIIGKLREWFPESILVGSKLLEKVSKEELLETARKLAEKNSMDYILANDLEDLRQGDKSRYLVNRAGFTGDVLASPLDIFSFINNLIKNT